MANIWCTLVMLGDKYVPGALVLAKSLREVGTQYPIWCMYDESVSAQAVEILSEVFDKVLCVPLITKACVRLKSQKQNKIYGQWIHHSFTKWHVLNPELFPVDRVILLDADIIALQNIDELFELPAPALTFSNPWARPYNGGGGIYNPYGEMRHGQRVSHGSIVRGFNSSFLGFASLVLVTPSSEACYHFNRILNQSDTYGTSKCISGFDEQIIAEVLLAMKMPIYHIHQKYNWFAGKYNWLLYGEEPYLRHYYNEKPWLESREKAKYEDIQEWWDIWDRLIEEYPSAKALDI